jgi:hypothetical protein
VGAIRTTIDPDNFHGGFSIWSGTSFAAPILAAEIAKARWNSGTLDGFDAQEMVSSGWKVLDTLTGLERPMP